MRVLLIRPRNVYNYNNYPSLGLISLGSKLEAQGHNVQILNSALETAPLAVIEAGLKMTDLVGVTFLTSEVPDAYRILHYLASTVVPVVVGGMHPTLFPEQVCDSRMADWVVVGEGEEVVASIVNGSRLRHLVPRCIEQPVDIETLPIPNYSLDRRIETFITGALTDPLSTRVVHPMRWLPYESSRGCPHRCTFCVNTVTGNTRYRKKSANKVVADLGSIAERYKLTHLKFVDDDFFVDIGRVRDICHGLIVAGLNITWDAECRCDYFDDRRLDDETLQLAKRSGLCQLTLGVESGSAHTLSLMRKGFEPEQGEKAVRKCDEAGILARCSFIVEVPGETVQDIKETVAFVNRLRRYQHFVCGMTTFRPYPKCELTTQLLASHQLKEPRSFAEWADGDAIRLYTAAEYARPWQVRPRYSERAAHYLTLESGSRLGDHQLGHSWERLVNRVFRVLARWRNRLGFYGAPIDRWLYQQFTARFYRGETHG